MGLVSWTIRDELGERIVVMSWRIRVQSLLLALVFVVDFIFLKLDDFLWDLVSEVSRL